jgi:hypothetical protein
MLPSLTHLLYCTTYSKFLNPPPPPPSGTTAPRGPGPLHYHGFTITLRGTTLLYDYSRWVISPTQRPLCDNTQHSQDRRPCPRWDSNSQSQQANGGRPTPYTARPLGSARIFKCCMYSRGAAGWGTALQTRRPQVRFLMVSLEFFKWLNPSSRTVALQSTQPLTETGIFPGG